MIEAAAASWQRGGGAETPHAAADLLAQIEGELVAHGGEARRASEACAMLVRTCDGDGVLPSDVSTVYARLGRLLAGAPNRPAAHAVFETLQARALASGAPTPLYYALLQARERPLRLRAVTSLAIAVEQGLPPAPALLERVAAALADSDDTPPALAAILAAVAGPAGVPELLRPRSPPWLRSLAARCLDAEPHLAGPERWELALGARAAARLGHYLAFTRASHRDLVQLNGEERDDVPLLASLDEAERVLGIERLARVIAQLGWSRVAIGLDVEKFVYLRILGGFPVLASPAEACLLEECGNVERCGEAMLVIAHGLVDEQPTASRGGSQAARIRRFRDYNVAHAELLNEILEVAPVTAERARRMLDHVARLADDFARLFAGHDEEAARAPAAARAVARRVAPLLPRDRNAVLGPEATRLVQGFEDPSSLDDVTTVHGLKRYLHQRGLRNAFRLFQSGASANRSVDLVLLDGIGSMRVVRRIRYIEFESSSARALPPIVRCVVNSYARWVAHGTTALPDTRLLIYAHEVQIYLSYRAHPAFVRLDLSPPRRGGMIDLEYFAVSQNDLGQHPARHLTAIQEFLRRIGFFVTLHGLRIHARYDKERAFDRADILDKVAALLRLTPLLMDLDWTIGSLAYPSDAQALVRTAWADFFERHGVLPLDTLLTADRTRILSGALRGEEDAWDGIGQYRDRFPVAGAAEWWAGVASVLERHGIPSIVRAAVAVAGDVPPGQSELERRLLQPLRSGVAEGSIIEADGRLRPADTGRYREVHEAVRFAVLLEEGGVGLEDAARLGAVVRNAFTLFRFRTTGTVQGCRVERADLALSIGQVALFVLCDAHGSVQLAYAVVGSTPAQVRDAGSDEWRWRAELDTAAVLEQLLRDNYVSPSPLLAPLRVASDAGLRALFARPAFRPPRAPLEGDRVVEAEAAAPGRAAGVVRMAEGMQPEQVHASIMTAPVVRAEDAMLLNAAAGIVTTGGGILSHAALLALEMRKPSLLLRGTWHRDAAGAPTLTLGRTEYRELRLQLGGCDVVCWEMAGEHVEQVRDGDLVAIDADEGAFRILGQDTTALALHHGLEDLDAAARQLAGAVDDARLLELRGRLLRTMHALRRLLRELASPALAHHVARQLVAVPQDLPAQAVSPERRELLRLLLDNPRVGAAAVAAASAASGEMRARFEALVDEADEAIPVLTCPVEVIFLRHAVVRLAAALRILDDAHGTALGGCYACDGAVATIEELALARLIELRSSAVLRIDAGSGDAAQRLPLPHLERQLRVIDAVLGPPVAALRLDEVEAVSAADAGSGHLAERLIVSSADGGLELRRLIGNKAAGLGEVERILEGGSVPPWFALTDRAFQRMLDMPVATSVRPGACRALRDAIADTVVRSDGDAARSAAIIAGLWRDVAMPPDLRDDVAHELDRLGGSGPGGTAAVAIRSSSFEEDRLDAAWAGQFSTFLNVNGLDAVIDHLKLAWAGFWNERALHRRGPEAVAPGGGLIVQRFIAARAAGVLHTASVATAELRTMVANVGLGLGAGVVSGEVGVDEIRIVKASAGGAIADVQYRIGDKRDQFVPDPGGSGIACVDTVYHQRFRAALEYSEVYDLASMGLLLESVLGHPLDIEFAFEGEQLRVLQLRPIPVFYHALTETLRRFPFPASR